MAQEAPLVDPEAAKNGLRSRKKLVSQYPWMAVRLNTVSDTLAQSTFKVGYIIKFMAQKIHLEKSTPEVFSMNFILINAPAAHNPPTPKPNVKPSAPPTVATKRKAVAMDFAMRPR